MNESGETSRLCPEGCSVDAHCTHLGYSWLQLTASGDHVFMLASDIKRTRLENTKVCLLRNTITSGELVKYAEFETWSIDSPKMFLYGGFLFIHAAAATQRPSTALTPRSRRGTDISITFRMPKRGKTCSAYRTDTFTHMTMKRFTGSIPISM